MHLQNKDIDYYVDLFAIVSNIFNKLSLSFHTLTSIVTSDPQVSKCKYGPVS
jgi:hypothetical protein